MKDSLYTLGYAAVLGLVCAVLLTGVGRFTRPYREANAKAEEVRNIVQVLGVAVDPGSTAKELVETFKKAVKEEDLGRLKAYVYTEAGSADKVLATAISFSGPGLWGPIRGFLALEPDLLTIRGITFHEQEETPGLGGEIASDWFRNQFKGKRIRCDSQPGIKVLRGGQKSSSPCEVDGITGATGTCEKVEAMLNATIAQLVKEQREHGD